jgi:hypothetical protein
MKISSEVQKRLVLTDFAACEKRRGGPLGMSARGEDRLHAMRQF